MSPSPAKILRRSSQSDKLESATSPRKCARTLFEPDENDKTCHSNSTPIITEEAPCTPPSNTRSKRKQVLTNREWFIDEFDPSLASADEEDLSAPASTKAHAATCADKCTPPKNPTRPKRSSTQSSGKKSPQTPTSQAKMKHKLDSSPLHQSDEENIPGETCTSSRRNSASRKRSLRTPESHSKAKKSSITPLHKKALMSNSHQKDDHISVDQIEETLSVDELLETIEKSNCTPGSSKARRRLHIPPSDKEVASAKLTLPLFKNACNTLPRIEESCSNSVSPEKPNLVSGSDTTARRQLDVTSPEKQLLIAQLSFPTKEPQIMLSRIDATPGIPISPEKRDRTPRSNSTARCLVDVTPDKESSCLRRSIRTLRSTPQKLADYDITPDSARRTLLRKAPVTPSRSKQTPKKTEAPTTPKSAKRTPIQRTFFSTPQSAKFRIDPNTPRTPIDEARANLHISAIPQSLPCRQTEFDTIYNFLVRKIESQSGGVMYISGVPGTGKTATVHKVVALLQEKVEEEEIDPFAFVEVNALRVSEPRQAYVKIWKDLKGELASVPVAQSSLEKMFSRPAKKATIILVDELDYLCNRKQDVIYNILDWTTKRDSRLIVLTIANTMDLPERTLKGRVTSRMGLTRLIFQPYNHTQLQQIVMNRLEKYNVFHPDAVQLVSRKVAAVSGDARRALDICRKATDLVDEESIVTIQHVQKVLNTIFAGPRIQAIQHCSEIEQLVLRSLRDESHRTGVEETYLKKMYQTLVALCAIEDSVMSSTANPQRHEIVIGERDRLSTHLVRGFGDGSKDALAYKAASAHNRRARAAGSYGTHPGYCLSQETVAEMFEKQATTTCTLYVPDIGCISQLCTKLSNMGLIIAENSSGAYLYRKLILNISADDLHFALEDLNSS